ncbi:MAG: restriction endonuclease [Oscillospiraceae bacterium]|jgi:site-specific DNA-methyltransferase (adenine-specific)|nr:restriction endonuclease [Oscillospiraceae bacterium]
MKNQLFYGDNIDIMRGHVPDGSVDLCYIDPPFNSKRDYNRIYNNVGKEDKAQSVAFVDTWEWNVRAEKEYNEICVNEGGVFTKQTSDLIMGLYKILGRGSLLSYLVSMTLRINEIHRVLKPTGSFYLHCDPTVGHYLKIVLDAVFVGRGGNFRNEIVWCYRGAGYPKNDFGRRHDLIFRYSKTKEYFFNPDPVREPYAEATKERFKHHIGNVRKGKDFGVQQLNPLGKHPDDWWQIQPIAPSSKERLGYPTQKPEALLEKIMLSSSNEGDVVLDAFCGCGTSVAVAQRLNRKWIGIDITYNSISLIIKRLTEAYGEDVMDGVTVSGIPADMESARALANKKDDRLRKEFEKWAVLTYSDNKAMINDKKGKDYGIDGTMRVPERKDKFRDVLFSVKSGKVNSAMIRDFRGVMERENAAAGIFITLNEPTKDMRKEAASAGFYDDGYNKNIEKIKIVTIGEILKGERLNMLAADVLKKAERVAGNDEQMTLL